MIERASRQQLARWLQEFPAVALLGPRQVGKTTLALQWAAGAAPSVYVDVEDPTDLARLADPLTFMEGNADRLPEVRHDLDGRLVGPGHQGAEAARCGDQRAGLVGA